MPGATRRKRRSKSDPPASSPAATPRASNGAMLGFEATLWQTADKLRNNMDAAEYKHVVLGLIFLKYISDAFEEKHAALASDTKSGADQEDADEYRAENIFWVHKDALVVPPRRGEAADDRQEARPGHGRHRARQPHAQGRAAEGLRAPRARQARVRSALAGSRPPTVHLYKS
jgi:hypothetical protein